jgi:hypothetical protein
LADGNTPMCEALDRCYEIVNKWVNSHSDSFPPVIINITDGEATDGDPLPISERIRTSGTNDGFTLLFNIHISPSPKSCVFYLDEELNEDDFAKTLFRMSSNIPPALIEHLLSSEHQIDSNARGFAYNADLSTLVSTLDIGTRPAQYLTE